MLPPDAPARIAVRDATASDVEAICEIAGAAWRATYRDLIDADAIERFLAQAYAPERVTVRLDRHDLLVASFDGDPLPSAFAEIATHEDHLQIVAIYARPDARGQGLGSALLGEIIAVRPGHAIAADVLVGNTLAEPFYAARGFEPGELLVEELAGEPIRERRWWLRPPGLFDGVVRAP